MSLLQQIHRIATEAGYTSTLDEGEEFLHITNDVGINLSVITQDKEILIESVLAPASRISDIIAFNDEVLRTQHRLFPSTAIAINEIEQEDYYVAFATVSEHAKEQTIAATIANIFDSVESIMSTFDDFFIR